MAGVGPQRHRGGKKSNVMPITFTVRLCAVRDEGEGTPNYVALIQRVCVIYFVLQKCHP